MKLGAEELFDPMDESWPKRVKEYLKDRRVDLAVDAVAGTQFSGMIEVMANHGKVSVLGRSGGAVPSFNTGTLFFRRLRIGGVAVGAYSAEEARAAWGEVTRMLAKTGARPVIDRVFGFEELVEAFTWLEGKHLGKVLIRVGV